MIHPKIHKLISSAQEKGLHKPDTELLLFLRSANATQTEAFFVLHQGYGINLEDADKLIWDNPIIFEAQSIEDTAYETFLYMNYNPDDPNFIVTENMIQFPMKRKDSK